MSNCKSSKSSSSTSSSSLSRSSTFSEDCDDSMADATYCPKSPQQESDIEDRNDETFNPSANSTTEFRPLLENCPRDTASTVVQQSVDSTSISYAAPSLGDPQPGTSTSKMVSSSIIPNSPLKKGEKRTKQPENWKRNIIKKKRNSGMEYESHSLMKKVKPARQIKNPCAETCKLECYKNFSDDERKHLFNLYWALGDIEKQRQYIDKCMQKIEPRYRYMRIGGNRGPRQNNNAFFFKQGDEVVRVCKLFFKNTLDITDRSIRTVLDKHQKLANQILEPDQRGKHGKQKKHDPKLKAGIKEFIDKIPKIESHYTRANTSKTFIEGSKTVTSIYNDYVDMCKEKNEPFCNYIYFYRTFTDDFNISFFVPKKDLCEECTSYSNMDEVEKINNKEKYENHLNEKNLARDEKRKDKEDMNVFVAVYDLQAVMQLPKGDVSAFYYKSKLNVFNFTIYDIKTNKCQCFVWDEANGRRGVNELGTCVLQYIKNLSTTEDAEIIFYSDNCAGQQKNKFMIAMYLYAVRYLGIKSITHKYLIKGHTQNEGDSAHSLIERQTKRMLKSGPIYTTEGFVSIIRSAKKKGDPFNVNELCFEDFLDLKILANDIGPLNMVDLKLALVKTIRVQRESPNSVFYKTAYADEKFKEAIVIKKKMQAKAISLNKAFHTKPGIPENKRADINELIKKKLIPNFYKPFYDNL